MDHALHDTQSLDIARRIVFSSGPKNLTRISLLLTVLGVAARFPLESFEQSTGSLIN